MESHATTVPLVVAAESIPATISVSRPLGTIVSLVAADISALIVSLAIASVIRNLWSNGAFIFSAGILFPAIILTLCSLVASRLYPGVCENPVEELRRLVIAATLTFLCFAASTFAFHDVSHSRLTVVIAWCLSLVLFPAFRTLIRSLFSSADWWGCPVVILGAGITGKAILKTLTSNRRIGLRPVAVLDDNPAQLSLLGNKYITGPLSRSLELGRDHRISYAIVCMPSLSRRELLGLLDRYGHCFSHIMVIPDLIGMASLGLSVREVGGIIGLEVTQRLLRPSAQVMKRIVDLVIVAALSPVVLPLVALCAALIKLESPGPVFFGNLRVGLRGREFKAWKLRSMVVNGDDVLRRYLEEHPEEQEGWRSRQKLRYDPRITRVGRIIRKTSIDELPQLLNVLVGEMSVVGPRPMFASQVPLYGRGYELYKRVRPGITGLWQISGRNHLTFSERASLDGYTIQNWSVWLDIYILFRTISVVLTAKGAY